VLEQRGDGKKGKRGDPRGGNAFWVGNNGQEYQLRSYTSVLGMNVSPFADSVSHSIAMGNKNN